MKLIVSATVKKSAKKMGPKGQNLFGFHNLREHNLVRQIMGSTFTGHNPVNTFPKVSF